MDRYDPMIAPDPATWLALDERDRLRLVETYHTEHKAPYAEPRGHAIAHTIVENQIAEGDALPVREKARQLMAQGLDRHDTIHAISYILAKHMNRMMSEKPPTGDSSQLYFAALKRLNANDWRRIAGRR